MPPMRSKDWSRFISKIVKKNGCWVWTGPLTKHGKLFFWLEGRNQAPRRVAYGPLADNVYLVTTCNNKMCVKPSHMQEITDLAKYNKDRPRVTHCKMGHSFAKHGCTYTYTRVKNGKTYTGTAQRCNICSRDRQKVFKYGLRPGEFAQMSVAQKHRCKICHRKVPLYLDHCHTTGKARGLLCHQCNTGLGMFRDDRQLLTGAITYLAASV